MMGKVLRAGLVGCGSVSQRGILPHLSLPDAREKVRLVAVADAVEERARQSAERFDVPAHFTRVEDMLAGVDIDLVLVATPIPYHFANAMAASRPGAGMPRTQAPSSRQAGDRPSTWVSIPSTPSRACWDRPGASAL